MKTLLTLIAIAMIALTTTPTKAAYDYNAIMSPSMTDYNCVQDCIDQGYMYGYCTKICSY